MRSRARGVALVIVLVLLAVIGLTTAAGMRGALTTQRVTSSLRFDASAQQAAELALRECEAEIDKPQAQRITDLSQVDSLSAVPLAQLKWSQANAWVSSQSPPKTAARHTLPAGSVAGAPQPQCLVERLQLPNGPEQAFVVTARGFSPGYTEDSTTHETSSGSVVWLQSILYYN